MITLPDALHTEHVALDLHASSAEEALAAVALLLRHDARINDWEEFFQVLRDHPPCRVADEGQIGICIPHSRGGAVNELVIAAARLEPPLDFPEFGHPVRYVFCIGVPQAMAADYLRLVGALMRIFKQKEAEAELHAAASRKDFVEILGRFEMKL